MISSGVGFSCSAQGLSRSWGRLWRSSMCSSGGAQEPGRARDRGFTPSAPTEPFCSPGVEGVQTPNVQRGQEERLKQILAEINVNLLNLPCLLLFPSAPPFSFLLLFLNSIPLLSKSSLTLTAVSPAPFCHPLPAALFSF